MFDAIIIQNEITMSVIIHIPFIPSLQVWFLFLVWDKKKTKNKQLMDDFTSHSAVQQVNTEESWRQNAPVKWLPEATGGWRERADWQ